MQKNTGNIFIISALVMLTAGLFLGVTAAHSYIIPDFLKESFGFLTLRPMHVSAIMFWILLGATGCVYNGLLQVAEIKPLGWLGTVQWILWVVAIVGVFYSYITGTFGGREYWEFSPVYALPVAGAWILFLINFIRVAKTVKQWPVYLWMWMTGIVFFLFTFTENYLWVFDYFRESFIKDTTIQWKANGSLVGSWNQILYGTAFFMMEKISGNKTVAYSKLSFGMYFLGLFNLMFNWGHHVYTLPTDAYIRYVGYAVSMTEWIFFARIIYNWKQQVSEAKKHFHFYPYRFILASEFWVFVNMGQAILMSIPAFNLYTHGTHVTVAHAMGTTIGINTMILLAACFMFTTGECAQRFERSVLLKVSFWTTQGGLFVFWLSLNIAGIKKGMWQMQHVSGSFSEMMSGLQHWFYVFLYAGIVLMLAIGCIAVVLLRIHIRCMLKQRQKKSHKRETITPGRFVPHIELAK